MKDRNAKLREIFHIFDLEKNGVILKRELYILGRAKRVVEMDVSNRVQQAWTPEKNERLMERIDYNGDGKVEEGEFVKYFRFEWSGGLDNFGDEDFLKVIDLFEKTAVAAKKEVKQAGYINEKEDDIMGRRIAAMSSYDSPKAQPTTGKSKTPRNNPEDDDRMLARLQGQTASPKPTSPAPTREARSRISSSRDEALRELFAKFDLDSSGAIEPKEFMALGKARKTLGQRSR